MNKIALCFLTIFLVLTQVRSEALAGNFSNPESLMAWVENYRAAPQPNALPAAVRAMKAHGLLREPEKSAYFSGFIGGVLADNPRNARRLVKEMFPLPPKEQGIIIRAIAYSGLPEWRAVLHDLSPRMPHRKILIDQYLSGEAKTLMVQPLESGSETIYSLWGFYVATGYHPPVARIILALRWSTDRSEKTWLDHVKSSMPWNSEQRNITRLGIGATAKWTLAAYAERHRDLLDFYRSQRDYQPERIALQLDDVIEAAETFESDRIREQELAAIDDAKIQEMREEGQPSAAASAGSVAIATGCVVASAVGSAELGIPCIITGALYNGAVKMFQAKN